MALTDDHRQRATIIGRKTWFFTGITLVVMGVVAVAAELVLQQKLRSSNCDESRNDVFQSPKVKVGGIWCGILTVFYGLLTISVGIYRNKAMMMMQALLSVLFVSLASTLLLISDVSIVSNYNHNMSSFNASLTEAKAGPQSMTAQHEDPFLRFLPSDRIRLLEGNTLTRDHGTKLDGKSSTMNINNDDNVKYQHEPDIYGGYRQAGTLSDKTEEQDHDMDRDQMNGKFSEGQALNTDDDSYEYSGFGGGLNDDEDSFEPVAEKQPEREEYDLYDHDLEISEGNKTVKEFPMYGISTDRHDDDLRGTRKERDLRKDCPEEEENTRQWFIQWMSRLMAVVRFIVLVLSIVLATLIFAPFCCYQTDTMANTQTSSRKLSAGKDDSSLWSDDATLLPV